MAVGRALGHLDDRVEADVRPLDVLEHLGIGRLHRGADLQCVAEDPRHVDDSLFLVLGRRHHDVPRPAAAPA